MGAQTDISRRALLFGETREHSGKIEVAGTCLANGAVACRICEDSCDQTAIRFRPQMGGKSFPEIDEARCTGCAMCVPVCPVSALAIKE